MRVDTEDGGHRFAACVGSYGYMGDLMALSERMRWLGPARYGLAGALTLLRGRAYGAAVSLLPAAPARCVPYYRLYSFNHWGIGCHHSYGGATL